MQRQVKAMQTMYNPYQYPQYQPQFNPYMDRINNLQQYQQALQPQQQNVIGGKVVDSIDIVKATDIPMNGEVFYFPKADGTEIYAKSWLANGTTQILTFKPSFESDMSISSQNDGKAEIEAFNEATGAFMKRFDDIENKIDKLKPTTNRTKKESVSE